MGVKECFQNVHENVQPKEKKKFDKEERSRFEIGEEKERKKKIETKNEEVIICKRPEFEPLFGRLLSIDSRRHFIALLD